MARGLTQDMTNGSPIKIILKFSLPMLIGNLFQQLYNMVDSIVVGKYVGKEALAAVGASGPLLFLIIGLTFGLSAGISIVISQYFGAKDYDNVRKGFASATYIVVGVSIIMSVIGLLLSRQLLVLLNTPATIIDQSEIYMKIIFLGVLGLSCYNGMAAVLRALGDSITPLIFLIIASLLNVALDFIFVVWFQWGVAGVGIATVISQVTSAIGCILYAMAKVKVLRMPIQEFKPEPVILRKCFRLGIPVALQNSFVSVSLMALQGVINGFDEVVIAANTVAARIEQLVLQPSMSVGAALAAYTGQNIGAAKIDRVKQGFKSASIIMLIFSFLMLPVMYFGGEYILTLFTKKEDVEVARMGIEAIRITCFFYSFVGMIFVTRNFLSGTGDIHIPMIMGFVEVICRVLFANILASYIGYYGIWWATALTWFVTALVGIVRVGSGKWKKKSIIAS